MNNVKTLFNGQGSYGYQISARASMVNYNAGVELSKSNTYTNVGSYSYNYSAGDIFNQMYQKISVDKTDASLYTLIIKTLQYFEGELEEMTEKIKEIIAEQLSCKVEDIEMGTSFKDDLGADSLDLFELVMALEEEYEVEIPSEDLAGINTVEDVVNYLKNKGIEL